MSEAAFESARSPEPQEPIVGSPEELVNRALSATHLYGLSPEIDDQPETEAAIEAVIRYLTPPGDEPVGDEAFSTPDAQQYYWAFRPFAVARNPFTRKYEKIDRREKMQCAQAIWGRMDSASKTLATMRDKQAIAPSDREDTVGVLIGIAKLLELEKITFNKMGNVRILGKKS